MSPTEINGGCGRMMRISPSRTLVTLSILTGNAEGVDHHLIQYNKRELATLIDVLKEAQEELNRLPPIGVLSDEDRQKIAFAIRASYSLSEGARLSKTILGEPT